MSIEAMKLAIEALEDWKSYMRGHWDVIDEQAITSLRQAIADAEKQETNTLAYREAARLAEWLFKKHYAHEEHYASGQIIWGLCDTTAGVITQIDNMVCQLVRAEKQEPVAWIDDECEFQWIKKIDNPEHTAFYTHPQPKQPLTDDEIAEVAERMEASDPTDSFWRDFARAIEAAHGIKE